jgi:predicted unusual protein kinase regulating ubiquinone biosynthesis (AarF/ABC1/UbiB family)
VMSKPITGRRRRSIKILRLFFSFVFGFFFEYVLSRLGGRPYDYFADSDRNRSRARQIRTTALEMGGVLIKVGQFLSSRVDLLPPEYIEELSLLQDEVPSVPFSEIRLAAEKELGGALERFYSEFSEAPLAAASLGQVHRATLHTGHSVAVKVQRPNIEEIVEADLGSLRYIVGWLERFTSIRRRVDLSAVLVEFEDTLRLELDYIAEGHHAERIAVMFSDDPRIAVPRVFWSHSTARLLTLQYMWGTKVTDFASLEHQGISRALVAEILIQAYLKQVMEVGFFHADPHPGNIAVRPGPVVVLLDFGMVGEITPAMRENLRKVFLGVIRRDFEEVLVAAERLGFITSGADRRSLKRALAWMVDTFYEMSLGDLQEIDPRYVLSELQDVLFSESLRVPANFAFLGRALGTLVGLATALDPSFQFVEVAEPYARSLVVDRKGVVATLHSVAREARNLSATAYSLPYLTQAALMDVRSIEADFGRRIESVTRSMERLETSVRRILYGLLVLTLLFAASTVLHRVPVFTTVAFAISTILLIAALMPRRRKR